jgi:hypothetical protein
MFVITAIELAHLGRNHRYLVVEFPVFINSNASLAIAEGMTMKLFHCISVWRRKAMSVYLGSLWLSCQFSELLSQNLLLFNSDVLVAEKHDTALRYCET